MTTLPMDIIFTSILPKLPAKSLNRFKCVAKSFLAEISSPEFIKLQHKYALSSDANSLLAFLSYNETDKKASIYTYNLDSLHHHPTLVSRSLEPMLIVASFEDHLLIQCGDAGMHTLFLILLNPSTRAYRKLPKLNNVDPENDFFVRYGMCRFIDDESGEEDFKVIRFDCHNNEAMVYSLKTNSWNLIGCGIEYGSTIPFYHRPALVQNRLFHLIITDSLSVNRLKKIFSFDMKAERWGNDVLLPDIVMDAINRSSPPTALTSSKPFDLSVLDGKLCFLIPNVSDITSNDLWIMKEYGVKESWVKLTTLPIDPPVPLQRDLTPQLAYYPLLYRNGSSKQILCLRDYLLKLMWYDVGENRGFEIELPGLPDVVYFDVYICKGSLSKHLTGHPPERSRVRPSTGEEVGVAKGE